MGVRRVGWTLKHHQLPLVEFAGLLRWLRRVGWTLNYHQLPLVEFEVTNGCASCRLDFKLPPTAVGGIRKRSMGVRRVGWTLKHHQLPLVEFVGVQMCVRRVGWILKRRLLCPVCKHELPSRNYHIRDGLRGILCRQLLSKIL